MNRTLKLIWSPPPPQGTSGQRGPGEVLNYLYYFSSLSTPESFKQNTIPTRLTLNTLHIHLRYCFQRVQLKSVGMTLFNHSMLLIQMIMMHRRLLSRQLLLPKVVHVSYVFFLYSTINKWFESWSDDVWLFIWSYLCLVQTQALLSHAAFLCYTTFRCVTLFTFIRYMEASLRSRRKQQNSQRKVSRSNHQHWGNFPYSDFQRFHWLYYY